jgi:hypothetical protein
MNTSGKRHEAQSPNPLIPTNLAERYHHLYVQASTRKMSLERGRYRWSNRRNRDLRRALIADDCHRPSSAG